MNSKDRQHLDQIQSAADYLMNGKGNGITTADIVEAMINDVQLVKYGRAPEALPALVNQDKAVQQEAPHGWGFTEPGWVQGLREENDRLKAALSKVPGDPKPAMVEPSRNTGINQTAGA